MNEVEYKRMNLKELCRKYNIEYEEEKMYNWYYFVERASSKEKTNKVYRINSSSKENLEEYIAEQLLEPLACAGILLKEKDFFEEYVDKIVYRHSTKGQNYKDELIVFINNKITKFSISPGEWRGFLYLSKMTNYFNIHLELNDKKEYEYSTVTNSVYRTEYGKKWLIDKNEYENGLLIFDTKLRKYILLLGDVACQLDAKYISFARSDFDFNPVLNIRYFIELYFSMLKKPPEIEPVFVVKDTEDNLKKIRKIIDQGNEKFAVCDYKEKHYYIKCLSGEDDELLFHLQL